MQFSKKKTYKPRLDASFAMPHWLNFHTTFFLYFNIHRLKTQIHQNHTNDSLCNAWKKKQGKKVGRDSMKALILRPSFEKRLEKWKACDVKRPIGGEERWREVRGLFIFTSVRKWSGASLRWRDPPSPWFRSLVQELAIIIYGGHSTCTQKPGMPRSVESRPLGDDRGGHWPRMIKRRENLAEITGNVRYRFEKKKR